MTLASYVLNATAATIAVTSTMPRRLPTASEASLSAAAVAGRPRGTLAKMIAVRTVVRDDEPGADQQQRQDEQHVAGRRPGHQRDREVARGRR